MNRKTRTIVWLGVVGAAAVLLWLGGAALWRMLLALHGVH